MIRSRVIIPALVVILSGTIRVGVAAPPPASQPLTLFCSLDRPVIDQDGTVSASVVADIPASDEVAYTWTATDGTFTSTGQDPSLQAAGKRVKWMAHGTASGAHLLHASARSSQGALGSCTLTVIVAAGERGAAESSIQDLARAFLAREDLESTGYGLYSYLLLPDECASAQSTTIRKRCDIFVREALLDIREEKDMKDADVVPSSHLNITYFLVKHSMPSDITADLDRHLDDQVSWILTNYDYARCHKLLLLLKDPLSRPGPIVISTRDPVFRSHAPDSKTSSGRTPNQLFQDFSDVPLNIMPLWFDRFRNQCFQEQFWEPNALNSFAWDLRKYLAIAGLGLPAAQASVKAVSPH